MLPVALISRWMVVWLGFQLILIKGVVVHLNVFRKLKDGNEFLFDSLNYLSVVTVTIPDGYLVSLTSDREYDSIYFIFISKLFTNHGKYQIFPNFVSVTLGNLESPSSTVFVCLVFPHGLYPINELNHTYK